MKSLNINSVTKYARATAHIKEIILQTKRLLKKGFAYQIKDGIYYDISKFKDYGKLSRRTVLQAEDAISRIDEAKEKRNKGDFCLWKLSKPNEPTWNMIIETEVSDADYEKPLRRLFEIMTIIFLNKINKQK